MSDELVVSRLAVGDLACDREIETFLAACGTRFAQQTTHWGRVIAYVGGDEPAWLGCRRAGRLVGVLPAYRYCGPLGSILNSVPQAGPLGGVVAAAGPRRDEIYAGLLGGFVELARSLDCDLATVISNPFWPDRDLYERYLAPDYLLENELLALSLVDEVTEDGTLSNASASLRRNLRRAETAGMRVDDEQSVESVEEWLAIHEERHREIGAAPLPRQLFLGALEHMVPADRARFFFVRDEATNEMLAGGLYLHDGLVMDAFMPSMRTRHAARRPNHHLAAHTIRYAKRRGFSYYNWQGSPPGGGVERFKRQWGGRAHRYCFATRVTGNAEPYLASSVEAIQEAYPWHYVLPFDRLGAAADENRVVSGRASAWAALEGDR